MMWKEVAVAQPKGAAILALAVGINVRTHFGQSSSSSAGTRSRERLNTKEECSHLTATAAMTDLAMLVVT
jgi:hypothetical protein